MIRIVFTFDTTHHALWAEETAREAGVPAEVVPAPPAARARCTLALETLPESVDALAGALERAGIPFGRWREEEGSGERTPGSAPAGGGAGDEDAGSADPQRSDPLPRR